MVWLLIGTAILVLFVATLRAFERASVSSLHSLLRWTAALGGIVLTLGLLLTGRGPQALAGLVLVGPVLLRRFQQGGSWRGRQGTGQTQGQPGGADASPPPGRSRSGMTVAEAHEILGLRPGASEEEIRAAHRRLMRLAHPDGGGSDWLASRINQARDVLLG